MRFPDTIVAELITILQDNHADLIAKATKLTEIKSLLKQVNVPDNLISDLFDALELALGDPSPTVYTAGLSVLYNYFKRLSQQNRPVLALHAPRLVPDLLQRLSDPKERAALLAKQCLSDLMSIYPDEITKKYRAFLRTSNDVQAKQISIHWYNQVSTPTYFSELY